MAQVQRDAILSLLQKSGVRFEHLSHEAVFTSEQAAVARGAKLSEGVKAMCLQSNHGNFYLFCLPADRKIDFYKASTLANELRLFLARPPEVLRVTGCETGSVSPFSGKLAGLQTFFDKAVLENESVEFNIGLHTDSVRMKSADLLRLIEHRVGDFVAD